MYSVNYQKLYFSTTAKSFYFDYITLVLLTNLDSKKLETNSKNVKPVIPRQIKKIKANND